MGKDPLDLFGRKIVESRIVRLWRTGAWAIAKKYLKLKNNRISTLIILILIAGCFFWVQNYSFGVQAKAAKTPDNFLLEKYNPDFFCQDAEKQNMSNSLCLSPQVKSPEITEIEKELYAMVRDYPIKEMIPYIAEYDREVAALIIGIAKKESNWGKRAPSKNGKTCYNYWGYKGAGSRGLAMGYGCFASPQEGVEVIGGRIQELADKNINTPRKMVVWKCGSSCRGHNPAGVQKWISDVNIYFEKLTT